MSADQVAFLVIRGGNALLWIILGVDLWRHSYMPLPAISRRLLIVVLVMGMLVLVLGALVPSSVPVATARWLYTAYTGFAAMVALAVRWTWKTVA